MLVAEPQKHVVAVEISFLSHVQAAIRRGSKPP
jgi:hypothetical protein